ncbi:Stk1 family PASTA domain-containing Ser/Thr kinase [Phaeacidiphilus oryzae]|uniref:Stk1 family PASTA domain-containing Ser/Thr kinase n=1 Tax=Phaeacidiphilus oryzae TaxID=348818 RepID=UPI000568D7E6|nr:Stk1 family PASTA domain-containing Ser/Thr kinase [Phaeacidiphilus oryzae]
MEEPRRLGGRYELGSVLGRGGMAEVYLAHDTRLGRTVAVKTLRADMARDSTFQARFRREAQSAASLNHPAIVAVYDTGEDYIDGISIPYIVMEYVDGSTLRELLHSGRRLLPERAMEMTIGILQALEYSHRNGIVHRDIKPANVMLTRNGTVKVMDFGIARAMGDSGMTMTQTSAVIGTAQYLSPEQAKGEQVDARSDLYSTGCLLYELLALRPPFIGDSPVAVAYQHVREEPQPPSAFDPEIRADYDAVILKALAKDRDYRYQSADEMRADIERALDGLPVAAAQTMMLGAAGQQGYGADPYAATNVMPQQNPGATTVMPPQNGNAGYNGARAGGYDNGGYDGYGDDYGGRGHAGPPRRRGRASWVLLGLAAVLVLAGSFFVAKSMFGGHTNQQTTVPNLVGKTWSEAQSAVNGSSDGSGSLKLVKGAAETCDSSIAGKGQVCSQTPAAETSVADGTTVTVRLSSGPKSFSVPDETGKTQSQATADLTNAGFATHITQQPSTSVPAGQVISQNPPGGAQASKGATITLTVSQQSSAQVPAVVGENYNDAVQQLKAANLNYAEQIGPPTPGQGDSVVVSMQTSDGTQVSAGQQVPAGTQITLVVTPADNTAQTGGSPSTSGSPSPTQGQDGSTGNGILGQLNGGGNGNGG